VSFGAAGRAWDAARLVLAFEAPDGHWERLVDVSGSPGAPFFQLTSARNTWSTALW
jgi:hypothetical protein